MVRFAAVTGAEDDTPLSAVERRRRERLRRPADRAAFTAAHVLVRRCAADLLAMPPEALDEVEIVQHCPRCGPGHGRPAVRGHPDLAVSLSHTAGRVAAIAVQCGRDDAACGIDVEVVSGSPWPTRALTSWERVWVRTQPDPPRAFTRLWVRKEALVKAGVVSLDEVGDLDLLDAEGPATVVAGRRVREWSAPDAVGAWVV